MTIPLEGDIPNRYPLYKVYMGLIIKGTIPRVPPFSPWMVIRWCSTRGISLNLNTVLHGFFLPGFENLFRKESATNGLVQMRKMSDKILIQEGAVVSMFFVQFLSGICFFTYIRTTMILKHLLGKCLATCWIWWSEIIWVRLSMVQQPVCCDLREKPKKDQQSSS